MDCKLKETLNVGCEISKQFWSGKKVFLTGHTGFKGSWLSIWLGILGAKVYGYSLEPSGQRSMYDLCHVDSSLEFSKISDIRDRASLSSAIKNFQPDIVFHMAAQSLVRNSYADPVSTYETNVMGTVNLLDACYKVDSIKSIIVVTTDKCYENTEQIWPYRECDRLGGFDPYSNSKACCELVVSSYQNSFFSSREGVGLATARAGNVIGGGDWSEDRLVPDFVRAHYDDAQLIIRNPNSIRPWQHVLDPLYGYLLLAEHICQSVDKKLFNGGWNFGPSESSTASVANVLEMLNQRSSRPVNWISPSGIEPHESNILKLDATKARQFLGWSSCLNLDAAIKETIDWYSLCYSDAKQILKFTHQQILKYMSSDYGNH